MTIYWVEKSNYEHLNPCLNKGLTAISKLQMQFTSFLKVFKIIEIWKSDHDLTNVTGTSYHWCYLITDVDQLPNESTKLLNILFKKLWIWYCMLNNSRKFETFWNSLFGDKSIWYRWIQDVKIKFASAINIK